MSNTDWLTALKNSPVAHLNPHLFEKEPPQKKQRRPRKNSKEVLAITALITDWCQKQGLELISEYRFHPARKWRSDWFIKELNLLVEYNGIFSEKSRHTTHTGYTGDMEKINAAQALGFRVLQFTPLNYKTIIQELEKFGKEN
jgi:hypothetical protein